MSELVDEIASGNLNSIDLILSLASSSLELGPFEFGEVVVSVRTANRLLVSFVSALFWIISLVDIVGLVVVAEEHIIMVCAI